VAGPPTPAEPDPDALAAEAAALRRELHIATRYRKFKTIAIASLAAAFVAFALVFGLALANTNSLTQANQEQARHLAAVTGCQGAYDTRLVTVLRARTTAAGRSQAALGTLIREVLHLSAPGQFQADVRAYQRAVAAAAKIPVPPLPPPACR
jgi:hypothetical protein